MRPYGFGLSCVLYGGRGRQSHVTEDEALLRRARAYDTDALAEMYDRYAPRMYAYVYHRVTHAGATVRCHGLCEHAIIAQQSTIVPFC